MACAGKSPHGDSGDSRGSASGETEAEYAGYVDFTLLGYFLRLKTFLILAASAGHLVPPGWLKVAFPSDAGFCAYTRHVVFLIVFVWIGFFLLRFSVTMQVIFIRICAFFDLDPDDQFFFFGKYALIGGGLYAAYLTFLPLVSSWAHLDVIDRTFRFDYERQRIVGGAVAAFHFLYFPVVFLPCAVALEKGNFRENIRRALGYKYGD